MSKGLRINFLETRVISWKVESCVCDTLSQNDAIFLQTYRSDRKINASMTKAVLFYYSSKPLTLFFSFDLITNKVQHNQYGL